MQDYDLLYPGINALHQTTRRNVAASISVEEAEANPSGELAAFLADAATKTPGYVAPEPEPLPTTDTIVSNGEVVTVGANTYTFTVVAGAITNIVVAPVA